MGFLISGSLKQQLSRLFGVWLPGGLTPLWESNDQTPLFEETVVAMETERETLQGGRVEPGELFGEPV